MEQLECYRAIVEAALADYARVPYAYGDIESRLVLDRTNDQFLLMNVGWDNG